MKLLTMIQDGNQKIGLKMNEGIFPIDAILGHQAPASIVDLMMDSSAMTKLRDALKTANPDPSTWIEESAITYAPCVPSAGKVLCVGLNYRKHALETNAPIPKKPILFSKFSDTVAAHLEDIPLPKETAQLDYEAELAIVIGKTANHVSEDKALDYVFGYCAANDLSARDLQLRTSQWLLGKTLPKFAPIGPWLVTADEIPEPNNLTMTTRVNGELKQNSNTADMIFSCRQIISYISHYIPLNPGDIIMTGTPEGVILGMPADKQVWLQPGDVMEIEIEHLGVLKNKIVAV